MALAKRVAEENPEETLTNLMRASDKSDWEWVKIPEKNRLGKKHDDFSINRFKYAAGEKYFVPPIVATELRQQLDVYETQCLKLLMNDVDIKAIRATDRSRGE